MAAATGTETDTTLKGILLDASNDIQSAREWLDRAADASGNPKLIEEIRAERKSLDDFLAQLAQARTIGDHDLFVKAVGELKGETKSIHALIERVKRVSSDTDTPGQVGGFMEQTVTFVTQALAFISELP